MLLQKVTTLGNPSTAKQRSAKTNESGRSVLVHPVEHHLVVSTKKRGVVRNNSWNGELLRNQRQGRSRKEYSSQGLLKHVGRRHMGPVYRAHDIRESSKTRLKSTAWGLFTGASPLCNSSYLLLSTRRSFADLSRPHPQMMKYAKKVITK